jgi:dCMP deaminase
MKKGEKRDRPSWDESFMFSAIWAAARSSCKNFQTGTVIVNDKRIVASGYNGAPPGTKNCLERGCRKQEYHIAFEDKDKGVCRGVHAEINAMSQISRQDLKGCSLYTLYFPCSACAKAISTNGISEVIYSRIYQEPDSLTNELFAELGVKLRKLDINVEKYFEIIRNTLKKR